MNKTAKIVITILLICNLILVTFLYIGKPNNHQGKSPREIIINKLAFDDSQIAKYEELIEGHRKELREIHKDINETKDELYQGLKEENPSLKDSLKNEICKGIKKIETLHFNHFQDIKELCDNSQKEKFNSMIDELSSIFQPKKGPKP